MRDYETLPDFSDEIKCSACGYFLLRLKFHPATNMLSYNDPCELFSAHIDHFCDRCGYFTQTKLFTK